MESAAKNGGVKDAIEQLTGLRASMIQAEDDHVSRAGQSHPSYVESQRNLLHYLALRRHDLRPLQNELAMLGLSSLGRAESHVLASVDAVLTALSSLSGVFQPRDTKSNSAAFVMGNRLLEAHTQGLLGPSPPRRNVRIMVTLPSEAQGDYTLIHSLIKQGMDVARINCAHDGPAVWERMIRHIRRAEREQGRSCRVLMDLAGPKLRTGPVEPAPAVLKWRPERNALGIVVKPARIWLTKTSSPAAPPTPADAVLPVPATWMSHLWAGDRVFFTDARQAQRDFTIVDVTHEGCWAESVRTAYVTPGIPITRQRSKDRKEETTAIADFTPPPGCVEVAPGDILILTRQLRPGRSATRDTSGRILTPARIPCTLPQIFNRIQTGERVWFDDGKVGGTIERVEPGRVFVRITHASPEGAKLRSDKGINLPDSNLKLPALTSKDVSDLAFASTRADMVALSFAQSAADVEMLIKRLKALKRNDVGIVLKIETQRGFEELPAMLLAAMKSSSIGVMIARGDLAVESGFERMAEVQEEILWICEAAHCPVIWATQVLETLAKEGIPSRAEITDAAMGHRAEAVMLNKGPHILRAVQTLDDILQRMEAHQMKKQSMMRELRLARRFIGELPRRRFRAAWNGNGPQKAQRGLRPQPNRAA